MNNLGNHTLINKMKNTNQIIKLRNTSSNVAL